MSDDGEEKRLFRDAVRGVKRLRQRRSRPARPKPRPQARFARLDDLEVLRESLERECPADLYSEAGRCSDVSSRGSAGLGAAQVPPRSIPRRGRARSAWAYRGAGKGGAAGISWRVCCAPRRAACASCTARDCAPAIAAQSSRMQSTHCCNELMRCSPSARRGLWMAEPVPSTFCCAGSESPARLQACAAGVRRECATCSAFLRRTRLHSSPRSRPGPGSPTRSRGRLAPSHECATPPVAGREPIWRAHSSAAGTTSFSSVTRSINPDARAFFRRKQDTAHDQSIGNTGADQAAQCAIDDWPGNRPTCTSLRPMRYLPAAITR